MDLCANMSWFKDTKNSILTHARGGMRAVVMFRYLTHARGGGGAPMVMLVRKILRIAA